MLTDQIGFTSKKFCCFCVALTNKKWVKWTQEYLPEDDKSVQGRCADEVRISEATVLKILHEDLGINKVSAHWIPKLPCPNKSSIGNTFAKKT
jgi:hypothetical protein